MSVTAGLESLWNSLTGQTAAEAAAAERAAQAAKIQQMNQAAQVYSSYRPQQQQARMNALSNISTAFQPANNALATMYGGTPQQGNYAARPAGYKPITAGGAGAQATQQTPFMPVPAVTPQQFAAAGNNARHPQGIPEQLPPRPTTQQVQTAMQTARPGSPVGVGASPSPAPQPAATSSARAPGGGEAMPARPTSSQMQVAMATARPSSGSTRALSGSLPTGIAAAGSAAKAPTNRITATTSGGGSVFQTGGADVRPGGDRVQGTSPNVPQGLPRSETPIVGGLPGYSDPTGSTGSVGSGNNPALGLAPGPSVPFAPAPSSGAAPTAQPLVGPAGVSFQPGQMLINPFAGATPLPMQLMSMPTGIPAGSPLAPTSSARPLMPVPPAEQVKAAIKSGDAKVNPKGNTVKQQSKDSLMKKVSTYLGNY